jgi:hypothetical protein
MDDAPAGPKKTELDEKDPSERDDASSDGTLRDASESDESESDPPNIDDATASFISRPVDPCDHIVQLDIPMWTPFCLASDRDKDVKIVVQPLCGYRVAVPYLDPGCGLWRTFDDLDLRWFNRSSPSSDARLRRVFSLWTMVLDRMIEFPVTSDTLVGILVLRHSYLRCIALYVHTCRVDNNDIKVMLQSCISKCQALDRRLNELVNNSLHRGLMMKVGY